MSTFGDRLAKELDKRELQQKDLAELTGITTATISRYITGQRNPSSHNAKLIANALGVSTDLLLGISSNTELSDKDLTEITLLKEEFPDGVDVLMRAKEELTPKQRKKMIEIMNMFIDSLEND